MVSVELIGGFSSNLLEYSNQKCLGVDWILVTLTSFSRSARDKIARVTFGKFKLVYLISLEPLGRFSSNVLEYMMGTCHELIRF